MGGGASDSEIGFSFLDDNGGRFSDLSAPFSAHFCVASGDVFDHPTTSPTISDPPALAPTAQPSRTPTHVPVPLPTISPSSFPTFPPSSVPSSFPTGIPTPVLSLFPAPDPSTSPTMSPVGTPTMLPSSGVSSDTTAIIHIEIELDGIAAAEWDATASSVLKATIAKLVDSVKERHVGNIAVAGKSARHRRKLLSAVTVSFDMTTSSAAESVADALATAVEDGTFTSTLQAEASAAGSDSLTAVEVTSIDSVVEATSPTPNPSTSSRNSGSEGSMFHNVALLFAIVAMVMVCGGCGSVLAVMLLRCSKPRRAGKDEPLRATMSNEVELTSGMQSDRNSNVTTNANPMRSNAKPTSRTEQPQPAMEQPQPPEEGWVAYTDEVSGEVYFYDTATGRTTWTEQQVHRHSSC